MPPQISPTPPWGRTQSLPFRNHRGFGMCSAIGRHLSPMSERCDRALQWRHIQFLLGMAYLRNPLVAANDPSVHIPHSALLGDTTQPPLFGVLSLPGSLLSRQAPQWFALGHCRAFHQFACFALRPVVFLLPTSRKVMLDRVRCTPAERDSLRLRPHDDFTPIGARRQFVWQNVSNSGSLW